VVCVVETREAEDSLLEFPNARGYLLDPMTGDNVVAIDVVRLPGVTSNRDLARDFVALQVRGPLVEAEQLEREVTYVKAQLQVLHLRLEKIHYFVSGRLSPGDGDAVVGTSRDVNHFLEFRMIQGVDGLSETNEHRRCK
jgi:hypothetical protein